MAGLNSQSGDGVSLWGASLTYTPASTVDVPAGMMSASIQISIYVGYSSFYEGRAYGFRMILVMSNGQQYTGYPNTYPSTSRGYVEYSFPVNNPTTQAINVETIYLNQSSQYNNNYVAYNYANASNSTVLRVGGVTISVSTPTNLRINGDLSYRGKTAPLSWGQSFVSGVSGLPVSYLIQSDSGSQIPNGITGSTSYEVDEYTAQNYSGFRVIGRTTYGEAEYLSQPSNTVSFEYNPYTFSSHPVAIAVEPPRNYVNAVSLLKWSGASPGSNMNITGYNVERSTNGTTFSQFERVNTNSNGGEIEVQAPPTMGAKYWFRVQTLVSVSGYESDYSVYVTLEALTVTKLANPQNIKFDRIVAEVASILSWDRVNNGTNNNVTKYLIYYQDLINDEWTERLVYLDNGNNISALVSPQESRGSYRRFFVQAIGSAGPEFDSDIIQVSEDLLKNILPLPPTNINVKAIVDPAQINADINFDRPEDIGNSAERFEVALKYVDGGDWVSNGEIFAVGIDSPIQLMIANLTRTASYDVFVRTIDIFGNISEWSTDFGTFYVNDLQAIPRVVFPQTNRVTYNRKPRIGIAIGPVESGRTFSIGLTLDQNSYRTNGVGSNQFSRQGSNIPSNSNTVFAPSQDLDSGNHSVRNVLTNDGISDIVFTQRPDEVMVAINYIQYTDDEGIVPKETRMKAAHINELRVAINTIRRYYGLGNKTWSEPIIAFQTRIKAIHIQELRDAFDEVRNYVNSFHPENTVNYIPRIVWTDTILKGATIKAVHIMEQREAVLNM